MFSWPNSADFGILEKKLEDPCATPVALPLDFLKHITGDFSKEQELGRGGGFFFFFDREREAGLEWFTRYICQFISHPHKSIFAKCLSLANDQY